AIAEVFSKYAVFRGRATRSEYWWWQLFSFLVFGLPAVGGITLAIIGGVVESTYGSDAESLDTLGGLLMMPVAATGRARLPPHLAVAVRRSHDMALSGWTYLLVLIASLRGIILVAMFLMPATPHPNQHGLPPTTGY